MTMTITMEMMVGVAVVLAVAMTMQETKEKVSSLKFLMTFSLFAKGNQSQKRNYVYAHFLNTYSTFLFYLASKCISLRVFPLKCFHRSRLFERL